MPKLEHRSKVAAEQHPHCPTRWSCLRLSYIYIGFISITHLTLPDGHFNILLTYLKTFSLLWDSKCLFKWTARINDFWQPSWGHTQGLYKINSIITSLTTYRQKPFIFSWNLSSFMLWLHWPQTAFITRIFEEKYALNRILSPSQRVWSLVVQLHSWATAWYLTKKHSFFPLLFMVFYPFISNVGPFSEHCEVLWDTYF